jgi:hypothetical protein
LTRPRSRRRRQWRRAGGGARRERALLGASLLTDETTTTTPTPTTARAISAASQVTGTERPTCRRRVSESAPLVISGNLGAMVERLDFEWTKSVQTAAPSTPEYLQRLRDEPALLQLAHDVHAHYAASGATRRAALVAELILEHLYFRAHDRAALRAAEQGDAGRWRRSRARGWRATTRRACTRWPSTSLRTAPSAARRARC